MEKGSGEDVSPASVFPISRTQISAHMVPYFSCMEKAPRFLQHQNPLLVVCHVLLV